MKIGILSFPNVVSHGASLQMFALYNKLSELGCEVEIINFCSKDGIKYQNTRNTTLSEVVISRFKKAVNNVFLENQWKVFRKFENQMTLYPSQTITTDEELRTLSDRYDRIIVGSDQVWNPSITGSTLGFYLDFVPDKRRKASYAPSFGVEQIDDDKKEQISALLKDFSFLSVREKKGAKIIKELTGLEVPVVLDPTFLLNREQWLNIAKPPKKSYGDYVLYYTVKPSPTLLEKSMQFAKETGRKFVQIGGGVRDILNREKIVADGVGPAEFLGLISNASYVITNSFHGVALSINLHKNFYVEYSSKTNSRLTNIIKTFDLQHCVVDGIISSQNPINIDYSEVNLTLSKLKEESLSYLESVVGERNEQN